jgi:hypothetical protein
MPNPIEPADPQPSTQPPTRLPGAPRAFLLVRHRDPSGVSGTGVVAEGTEWSDGSACVRWPGEHASMTFWETGVAAIEAVHGHNGATEVLFVPGAP